MPNDNDRHCLLGVVPHSLRRRPSEVKQRRKAAPVRSSFPAILRKPQSQGEA